MGIKLIRNLLLMTLIVSLNGCMTCSTLDRAESKTHTDSQGQTVTDRQGRPANYVLLLIAVPADLVTSPFQAMFIGLINLSMAGYQG
jgi:uncharacterized protein YceK